MLPKQQKKSDKSAPIDVDGASSGIGEMKISDNANPDYWSDDSGDESYGKIQLTERNYFDVYGGHQNDRFYIPPSGHRATMKEGNHIVPSVFLRFLISSLETENIKTLPEAFRKIAKMILPEKDEEIKKITKELQEKIAKSRVIRKEVTSKFGSPKDRKQDNPEQARFVRTIKDRFIEADKYDIHREIEKIASNLISWFETENSFSELRKDASGSQGESECLGRLLTLEEFLHYKEEINIEFLNKTNPQTSTSRGSQLRLFTDYTGDYRPSVARNAKDLLSKLNQLKDSGNRINMIKGIASCMCQPFDYSRTKKQDEFFESDKKLVRYDDEVVLYKSTARLMVIMFAAFKDIFLQLNPIEKSQLYDEVLDFILVKKNWSVPAIIVESDGNTTESHYVIAPDDSEQPIDRNLLKIGVEKFAIIDFTHELKMKDPNDPDPTKRPPTEFKYCDEQRRPRKLIKESAITENSTPQKPTKTRKSLSIDDDATAQPSVNPSPKSAQKKSAASNDCATPPSS
jgi:hypothetical protein